MSLRDRRGQLVLQGEGTTYKDRVIYFEGVNLVGRNAAKTAITIKDRSISEIHAKIICKNNVIKVMDMKSKNGVYLNSLQNQINAETQVQINPNYDILYFAQIKCRFIPDGDRKQNQQDTKQVTVKAIKPMPKANADEPKNKQNQQKLKQVINSKKQVPTKQKDRVNQENSKDNKKTKKLQDEKRQSQRLQKQKEKQQLLRAIILQQQANSKLSIQSKKDQEKNKVQKDQEKKKNQDAKAKVQTKSKAGKKQSKQKQNKKAKEAQIQKALQQQAIQNEKIKVKQTKKQAKQKQSKQKNNQEAPTKQAQKRKSLQKQEVVKRKQTKNSKKNQSQENQKNEIEKKSKANKPKDESKQKQRKAQSGETKVKGGNKRKNKSVGPVQQNQKPKPPQSRKRLPQGLNQSLNNYPRRSFNQKTALISGFALTFKPTIRINITQNWRDKFDVLVMQKYARTFKLLYAICLGVPIVVLNWIVESEYRRGIVPFERFYIQCPQKDLIVNSVDRAKNGFKVFKGLKFYLIEVEQSFHLPIQQIEALIEAGGGTILKKLNKKQDQIKQIVFILRQNYTNDDIKMLKKIENAQKVYTIQFILDGCLTQQLKWQQNKVKY